MTSGRLARRFSAMAGAVAIVAMGALAVACGTSSTNSPSTTTTTTTTTTTSTTTSPTEKVVSPTGGNQFSPTHGINPAPPTGGGYSGH
jgi:negative regulator of sigma E activity